SSPTSALFPYTTLFRSQGRDHGLAAVQAEALGAREALVQEALEALGLGQLLEDGQLAFLGEGVLLELARPLETLLQPGLLFRLRSEEHTSELQSRENLV